MVFNPLIIKKDFINVNNTCVKDTKLLTEKSVFEMDSGTCVDFKKKSDNVFVIGTEEGQIHKCSKLYSSQCLFSFEVSYIFFN